MKKNTKTPDSITTFLGADSAVEGVIGFDGTIRVDGRVSGQISSEAGTVIIGEKAVIDADVLVDVAVVMGRVNGMVRATSRIEVYPPACITGDIEAPVISIDAGVQFNGYCAMTSRDEIARLKSARPVVDSEKNEAEVKKFPKNF